MHALVALTAAEGRAAWVRHAAAVAVGRVGAADANARGRGGNEAGSTAPETAPEKAPETAPASNAVDDAPTSPDDDAFVEAAARVESLVVPPRRRFPIPIGDRAPDLHVRLRRGRTAPPPRVASGRRTPNDAIAALLTDRCGFVRVAATATLTKARKVDCVGAMHLLLPNLRAKDACLREATCRALTSLWTDEHGVIGGAVISAGKASVGGRRRRRGRRGGGQGGDEVKRRSRRRPKRMQKRRQKRRLPRPRPRRPNPR